MLPGCKPVTAATKLRSWEIISLFEHDLLMLSSCNRFKIAILCLQTNKLKLGKNAKPLKVERHFWHLPAEKTANSFEAVVVKRLIKPAARYLCSMMFDTQILFCC